MRERCLYIALEEKNTCAGAAEHPVVRQLLGDHNTSGPPLEDTHPAKAVRR
jgi:hypothetical protein